LFSKARLRHRKAYVQEGETRLTDILDSFDIVRLWELDEFEELPIEIEFHRIRASNILKSVLSGSIWHEHPIEPYDAKWL